jgi:exo-beta-1,3-glucanase (GH17 family)
MRSVAAVVALAACLHAGLWAFFQTTGTAPNIDKPLASVSYAPFEGKLDTDGTPIPTEAQIRADLKAITPYTNTIRLYRSTRGMQLVPEIAAQLGLKVTLGIGLEANLDRDGNYDLVPDDPDNRPPISRNEAEIRTALKLARVYSGTVNGIVVGNETTLKRSMVTAAEANEAQALYEKQGVKKDFPDFKSAMERIKADWDAQLLKAAKKDPRVIAAEARKDLVARFVDLVARRPSYDAVLEQVSEEV